MAQKIVLALSLMAGLVWPLTGFAHLPSAFDSGRPADLRSGREALVLVQDDGTDDSTADDSTADDDPTATEDDPAMLEEDLALEEDLPEDALGISEEETDAVAGDLSQGTSFCGSGVDASYKADCLSDQYKAAAKALPAKGGYAAARKALLQASDKLHTLATAHADTAKKPAKVSTAKGHSHRALTAVADPAQVNAKAAAIVSETKVVLLRSSEGSRERRAAYQTIAAGV
jgi:hypothetical protein